MEEITLKKIYDILPKSYELIKFENGENLEKYLRILEDYIQNWDTKHIENLLFEWHGEEIFHKVDKTVHELVDIVQEKFKINEDSAIDLITKHRDDLEEEIYYRGVTNTILTLIRNTPKLISYYKTGLYFECKYNNKHTVEQDVTRLKDFLKIPQDEIKYDKPLTDMLLNASGGFLHIYFKLNVEDFIHRTFRVLGLPMSFKHLNLGIVNTLEGTGAKCYIDTIIILSPRYNKIFIEKVQKHSLTYTILGLNEDWCDNTEYKPKIT